MKFHLKVVARFFLIASLVGSLHASENKGDQKKCIEKLIYLTDHPQQEFSETIENRKGLYKADLKKNWSSAKADWIKNADGEEILMIEGFEVMRGFEKPYMAEIAKAAVSRGGRVLNVGYGIGYIDDQMEKLRQDSQIGEHHIVELNREVFERAQAWRESQGANKDQIVLHHADWNEALEDFAAQGIQFDGIAYDAFPLEEQDLHRDFIPFLKRVMELKLLKEGTGVITFYMDSTEGFGENFVSYAKSLGVGSFDLERVQVDLPANQYWRKPFFLTPTLSAVKYSD